MQHDLIGLAPPTTEDIRAGAPDPGTWRAALDLAGKPFSRGRATDGLWAEFIDGRRLPIRSLIAEDFRVSCNCNNTRFPCRHVLALQLAAAADPPGALAAAPDWLPERLAALAPPPPLSPQEDARRLAALRAGLLDLERWLADIVHWGLAALPGKGPRFWIEAADRLADAYGPEIAHELRDLPSVTTGARDWPERLLPRLGRLQLLAEGFRHYDELPPAMQGDLRAAAGLPPLLSGDSETDRWLVLGHRAESAHRRRRSRTWLYGLASGRYALAAETVGERETAGLLLPVGGVVEATAEFHCSGHSSGHCSGRPLQADLRPGLVGHAPTIADDSPTTIPEALGSAAAARAANPWLSRLPVSLGDVRLEPVGDGWRLRDRSGALLPLSRGYGQAWHLLALAADRPMTLFGEWDGRELTPLSVRLASGSGGGRWTTGERWKGVS